MIVDTIRRIFEVITEPGALRALTGWELFSLASFKIIRRAKLAGVKPATVVDIGANIGQFSVASKHLFDAVPVYSIEPDPKVAAALARNLGYKSGQDFVFNIAVGDIEGKCEFNVNYDSQNSSILSLGADRIRSFPRNVVREIISVPITTLDILFFERKIDEPVLLKIDVQGYEDRVLAGATEFIRKVRWVIIEVSFFNLYEQEANFKNLISMMHQFGFEFSRPLNFHFSPDSNEIIEMDALFVRVVDQRRED
jgi:FkbM family methyltransferase